MMSLQLSNLAVSSVLVIHQQLLHGGIGGIFQESTIDTVVSTGGNPWIWPKFCGVTGTLCFGLRMTLLVSLQVRVDSSLREHF